MSLDLHVRYGAVCDGGRWKKSVVVKAAVPVVFLAASLFFMSVMMDLGWPRPPSSKMPGDSSSP